MNTLIRKGEFMQALDIVKTAVKAIDSKKGENIEGSMSFLKAKEKELLLHLIKKHKNEFTPIEVSREIGVTNKTVINRLAVLVKNGFVIPILVNERIRSYELSGFTKTHEKEIVKEIR